MTLESEIEGEGRHVTGLQRRLECEDVVPDFGVLELSTARDLELQGADLDGRIEHVLLLELFTDAGIGTMVTEEGP